jgi:hypothetical protein
MLGSLPRVGRCTGGEGTWARTEQEPGLAANPVGARTLVCLVTPD